MDLKRLKYSCIHSKGGTLVLMWSLLLATVFLSSAQPFISNPIVFAILGGSFFKYIIVPLAVFFLFFPAFAFVGERWTRHRVLYLSSVLLSVGSLGMLLSLILVHFLSTKSVPLILCFIVMNLVALVGFVLCLANIIQFGADQLHFAPSTDLPNLIYWFAFSFYSIGSTLFFIQSLVTTYTGDNKNIYNFSVLFCFLIVLTVVPLFLIVIFKKHLVNEPPQRNNPIRLIWGVLKFAKQHNAPIWRSAFTYGEALPSRMDLAKSRYGGPYSTEEVEDVKSFWNILLILLATFGYSIQEFSIVLSEQYYQHDDSSLSDNIINFYSSVIPYATVGVCVLVFQCIISPFFPRYNPSMLKLMWAGVLTAFLKTILLSVLTFQMGKDIESAIANNISLGNGRCHKIPNDSSFIAGTYEDFTIPFYVLIISQVFEGACLFLVFVNGLRFIMAQGPLSMQSLLIGIWLLLTNFLASTTLGLLIPLGCDWEYFTTKSVIIGISVIVYIPIAYKYKYRSRNEKSDVDQQFIITEYTERQIMRRIEHEKMEDYTDVPYHSIHEDD